MSVEVTRQSSGALSNRSGTSPLSSQSDVTTGGEEVAGPLPYTVARGGGRGGQMSNNSFTAISATGELTMKLGVGVKKQKTPEQIRKTRMVLVLLVVLKILTSYDGGAFSVVLGADNGLAADLGLSTAQGGTLGSAVFLGNLVGCIVAGNMFSQYPAKAVFILGMLAHAIFTFSFGFSNSFEYALIMRFLIGTTLAFPVVYSPIWVESFGPADRSTTWMALVNAGVPVGIMLGFVIGGLVPAHSDMDWRGIFYTKSLAMTPILIILNSMDSAYIDVESLRDSADHHQSKRDDTDHQQAQPQSVLKKCESETGLMIGDGDGGGANSSSSSAPNTPMTPAGAGGGSSPPNAAGNFTLVRLVALLSKFSKNPLYVCNVLSLSALYFVITALQTFVTPYLRAAPFNASMTTIVVGFGGTVVTAPVFGVIGGGILIDRLGGYHEHTALAMKVQAIWGFCAFLLSLVTLLCTNVAAFLFSMWCLLAVGGAIVPVATGVLIASVPEEERPAASSVSAMCFNLFGYFSGPLFCGMVADATSSLTWGIRVTLLCSVVGVFPSTYAAYVARTVKLPGASAGTPSAAAAAPSTPLMVVCPGDEEGEDGGQQSPQQQEMTSMVRQRSSI